MWVPVEVEDGVWEPAVVHEEDDPGNVVQVLADPDAGVGALEGSYGLHVASYLLFLPVQGPFGVVVVEEAQGFLLGEGVEGSSRACGVVEPGHG